PASQLLLLLSSSSSSSSTSPPSPHQLAESSVLTGRTEGDSLNFLDSMNLTGSTDAEVFRADMCMTPDPCQGMLCSRTSGSSGSPLPHTHSSTPPPAWTDRTPPTSFRSPFSPGPTAPPEGPAGDISRGGGGDQPVFAHPGGRIPAGAEPAGSHGGVWRVWASAWTPW
ncbi:hypothetical protein CRUP_033464, partial [Coryphaenoides rupestris]